MGAEIVYESRLDETWVTIEMIPIKDETLVRYIYRKTVDGMLVDELRTKRSPGLGSQQLLEAFEEESIYRQKMMNLKTT
jgi:hypothetical protein